MLNGRSYLAAASARRKILAGMLNLRARAQYAVSIYTYVSPKKLIIEKRGQTEHAFISWQAAIAEE